MGLAQCFAYVCTKTNPNWSKFGRDIAQISVHQFLLSSINFIINSTPQGPWNEKAKNPCHFLGTTHQQSIIALEKLLKSFNF